MRIAVLSDIHSNILALEAVLKDIDDHNFPIHQYWCLGDLIGYGLYPAETIRTFLKRGDVNHWAAGNHEDLYWDHLDKKDFDVKADLMMQYTKKTIEADSEIIDRLASLPAKTAPIIFEYLDGFNFILSHNAFLEYGVYPYPWCNEVILPNIIDKTMGIPSDKFRDRNMMEKIRHKFKKTIPTIVLTGHTHVPMLAYRCPDGKVSSVKMRQGKFFYETDCQGTEVVLINPGSVGFSRDNCNKASYLIIDTKEKSFMYNRVDYPVRKIDYSPVTGHFKKTLTPSEFKKADGSIFELRGNLVHAYLSTNSFEIPEEWQKIFTTDGGC